MKKKRKYTKRSTFWSLSQAGKAKRTPKRRSKRTTAKHPARGVPYGKALKKARLNKRSPYVVGTRMETQAHRPSRRAGIMRGTKWSRKDLKQLKEFAKVTSKPLSFNTVAPRPRPTKLVFITAFEISGSQHYMNAMHAVRLHQYVTLVPVNDNPHDPFAVLVKRDPEGDTLGWFPRIELEHKNFNSRTAGPLHQALHRMLTAGLEFHCVITARDGHKASVSVMLKVPT